MYFSHIRAPVFFSYNSPSKSGERVKNNNNNNNTTAICIRIVNTTEYPLHESDRCYSWCDVVINFHSNSNISIKSEFSSQLNVLPTQHSLDATFLELSWMQLVCSNLRTFSTETSRSLYLCFKTKCWKWKSYLKCAYLLSRAHQRHRIYFFQCIWLHIKSLKSQQSRRNWWKPPFCFTVPSFRSLESVWLLSNGKYCAVYVIYIQLRPYHFA